MKEDNDGFYLKINEHSLKSTQRKLIEDKAFNYYYVKSSPVRLDDSISEESGMGSFQEPKESIQESEDPFLQEIPLKNSISAKTGENDKPRESHDLLDFFFDGCTAENKENVSNTPDLAQLS